MTIRIGMWSGPRNISTAMMRSFENRSDFSVVDEPFYAYYLSETQSPHPMFEEVIKSQPCAFESVVQELTEGPCTSLFQYQKLMTHHMLPGCDLSWTSALKHCFLIRHPALVIASYTNSRGVCTKDDIGIERQYELYQTITSLTDKVVPVVETDELLANPETILKKLCEALEIPFTSEMLSWPQGRRDSDGVWADHWYHSVEKSTGFGPPKETLPHLNNEQQALANELMPFYEEMKKQSCSA